MDLTTSAERESDSPFVERVWFSQSEQAGAFTSIANIHYGLVVTRYQGKLTLTVRGPETRASPAHGLAGAEHFGIQFKAGTFMPDLPAQMVMDRCDVNLPCASSQSFWLHGAAWQFPDFENADTFVDRLVRERLLVSEALVDATLQGQVPDLSLRSVQRRFLRATGMTYSTLRQIERARYATILLKQGVSILDTVEQAGYADQPHLTRALKHMTGQTPAQMAGKYQRDPLSFLFKTLPY
ncbi:MAG: helix-turn-helix transcriptional regulator [Anaerolineae bacterium]|nr:helix-turn-helix transcriptional regulator [Anaerolineae bacterium]